MRPCLPTEGTLATMRLCLPDRGTLARTDRGTRGQRNDFIRAQFNRRQRSVAAMGISIQQFFPQRAHIRMPRCRWRGGTAWSQLRRNGTTLISWGEDSTSSIHDNVQQYSSFTLAGQPGFTAAHHFFGRAHFDTGKTLHGRLRKARDFVEYSQYAAV